ncbi:YbjQ family protein [uncultured Sneathiella sp.]|uniref:YbjQ family protein n=1 Tax=uncultured Sneathiella sp. TaxID=879315 RepID=UPI0030ED3B5C|tara:strand:+ start:10671 stop:11003 length:333 start_codon:yes stop_codon:yes gene_type:complete
MRADIIVTTTDEIKGHEITEVIGLVRGNVIRAKHIGTDIIAALRNLVGGEVREYTKLMAEAREQATDRMISDARLKGADAIVGMRFTTSMVMAGSAEILAFGTAVRLKQK